MKSMNVAGALCAALLALASPSQAGVVSLFDVSPNSITAGDQSALSLTLNVYADSGSYYAYFTGGSVTLNSGIAGLFQNFTIAPGPTSETFQFAFTYPTAGNYTPSFSFTANYVDQYTYQYYTGPFYYQYCNFGCYTEGPFYYGPYTSYGSYGQTNSNQGIDYLSVNAAAADVSSTPLPAALPLFAGGLGLIGLLARRRKQRHAAALH